jgi:hypothetical protein
MRALALALALIAHTAWPCSPAQLEPYTAKGHTGLRLRVSEDGSTLVDAKGNTRWSAPVSGFSVEFAADDSWVAFPPGLREDAVTIVRTRAGAKPRRVSVVGALSEDELSQLTNSSCGLLWFAGFEATPKGLVVHVSQRGQARPTQEGPAGLRFLITPDGVLSRLDPQRPVDLLAMAEGWKGPASPQRAELLSRMSGLLETPSGKRQSPGLGPLVKRVLTAADATDDELYVAGELVGHLPDTERQEATALALEKSGAVPSMLRGLPEGKERTTLAERVFSDVKQSARARAVALGVALPDESAGFGPLLAAALLDSQALVREVAAGHVGRSPGCSSAQATAVLAAYAREMKSPTPPSGEERPHERLVELLGSAVRNCLTQPPGRHAEVATALAAGLRLEDAASASPDTYLMMAAWAKANAPQSAVTWLDAAEASAKAQKYGQDKVYRNRVLQWRVLEAMKARDWVTARKRLSAFEVPADGEVALPDLSINDVGTRWVFQGPQTKVSSFVQGIEGFIQLNSR